MAGKDQAPAAEEIFPGLIRIVAPNPGPMTYHGTCTYLFGDTDVVIIDPGPDDDTHLAAILAAIPDNAQASDILLTHAHRDHTALAARLSGRLGLRVNSGPVPPPDPDPHPANEGIDTGFAPDQIVHDGDVFGAAGWQLFALPTPGHLSGHFCFASPDKGIVFTGDHVMGWASTFISPPAGSVPDYMASLDLMIGRNEPWYFPGHGPDIKDGPARARALKAHRLGREAQIIKALQTGSATAAELTAQIYDDTPKGLHPAAERNVLAHLRDLTDRGITETHGTTPQLASYHLRK